MGVWFAYLQDNNLETDARDEEENAEEGTIFHDLSIFFLRLIYIGCNPCGGPCTNPFMQ